MTKCDYCGQVSNIIFTCRVCGGKHCSIHRHNTSSECSFVNEKAIIDKNLETEEKNEKDIKIFDSFSNGSYLNQVNKSRNQVQLLEENNDVNLLPNKNCDFSEKLIEKYASAGARAVLDAKQKNKKSKLIPLQSKKHLTLESLHIEPLMNRKLLYLIVLMASFALNGVQFYMYGDYEMRSDQYVELRNNSILLGSYFEDLGHQYIELQKNYDRLNEQNYNLLEINSKLAEENEAFLNYPKAVPLDTMKTITLGSNESYTKIYEIPFSGFIQMNYNATDDTYVWVGSTSVYEEYYSRNPQFPDIASSHNFTIPVSPDIKIQFSNPNEFEAIDITYSIKFTQ